MVGVEENLVFSHESIVGHRSPTERLLSQFQRSSE